MENRVISPKINILMVDDRPENLLALEAVLTSPDYRLVSAHSGEEALKCVLREDFAVILLDVQMPGLNGFETAKIIKEREKSKLIPIIFITALSQASEHVIRGYSVGAIDYIFKPFHSETLRMKVEGFVHIYKSQQQIKLQSNMLHQRAMLLEEANRRLRQLEEERRHQFMNLEKLVEERTQELRRSNRQVESILESIMDAFFTVDKHWNFTYINQEAEREIGQNRALLLGRSLWEMYPQMLVNKPEFEKVITEQVSLHFETKFQESDRWYEIRAYPSEMGLSVYFNEITGRKRMLQALRLSQERFRKIFESSPNLMSIRSLKDSRYLDVNESWLRFTGYQYDEIQALDNEIFMPVDKEGKLQDRDYTEPARNVRINYRTKSGELRVGLLSSEIIELEGEQCLLNVVTDITEQVQMEAEMVRLDRMNLIGEMAAGIAHEIRNPMTTVRGFLQLFKTNDPATIPTYVDLMIGELDRANLIITEYLSLAKNKSSDLRTQPLNRIVEALSPLIQAEAMLSGKIVKTELQDIPDLPLDEKEIRQLILNLALNGLESMSAGGMLKLSTYLSGGDAILEVKDEGTGISPELLEKIGTPFFSTKEQGIGLGLAVCYSVAARHHALIEIRTDESGTRFLVRFKTKG